MKRIIYLILSSVIVLSLVSCDPSYVLQAETISIPETVVVTETVIKEVENTEKVKSLETEVEQYQNLLSNLNGLLGNVYYGYASNNNFILDGFTAFSLEYNDNIYLITAGHCVENEETGKLTNFKFKSNFSDEWIYPKLLIHDNNFTNYKDFAVFYSDKINTGLDYNKYNGIVNGEFNYYILGNGYNNVFKPLRMVDYMPGESGSPVINLDGEVIGILIGTPYTDIDTVLKAIDNLA